MLTFSFSFCSTKLSDEFYKENYSPKQLALVFENDISYLGKEVIYGNIP